MSPSMVWLVASVVLVLASLYLAHRNRRLLRHAEEMSELHLATLEALAVAIDAKDQSSHNHVTHVQLYATEVARALGMSEVDVQAVKTAALLHDIGKLAVPDHILSKPGPLTPDEFKKVRIHPQVGAEILRDVPFPYPVVPLILSHHERWDGRGYPSGLKGQDIPLGARILCLVEYFDAVTSERPYHAAMTQDAAIALIEQEAGKALDPTAVDAFVRILPRLREQLEHEPEPQRTSFPAAEGEGAPIAGSPRAAAGVKPSVLNDIALAHREIYSLYEFAQSMGTTLGVFETMEHISGKLNALVPFSTCALFLHTEPADSLSCRYAAGTDSELIQQLTIKNGQGLTGWVARNRRPLVNARPSSDLEAAGSNLPTELQSALVCPLVYADRLIGTLAVYHTTPGFYRDDHRRLLDRVCEQAAAVIHNSIVFEQAQEASLTDALTGLPNTRFVVRHVARELARAERLKTEVALIVMDLNDFKEINDSYGHQTGDNALRAVAHMLRGCIRPYDACVRYAGDEFIVVLAGCTGDEAENKRMELQRAVGTIMFESEPGVLLPLSISAGTSVYPHDGANYESLLARADARMYANKAGRKRHLERQVNPSPLPAAEALATVGLRE